MRKYINALVALSLVVAGSVACSSAPKAEETAPAAEASAEPAFDEGMDSSSDPFASDTASSSDPLTSEPLTSEPSVSMTEPEPYSPAPESYAVEDTSSAMSAPSEPASNFSLGSGSSGRGH